MKRKKGGESITRTPIKKLSGSVSYPGRGYTTDQIPTREFDESRTMKREPRNGILVLRTSVRPSPPPISLSSSLNTAQRRLGVASWRLINKPLMILTNELTYKLQPVKPNNSKEERFVPTPVERRLLLRFLAGSSMPEIHIPAHRQIDRQIGTECCPSVSLVIRHSRTGLQPIVSDSLTKSSAAKYDDVAAAPRSIGTIPSRLSLARAY